MFFSLKSWLRKCRNAVQPNRTPVRKSVAPPHPRLGLEVMEDRTVPAGAANDHTVLILGSTVTSGANSQEAQAAIAKGMTVEVASDAVWAAKTQAEFATYRALILGDPTCMASTVPITAAVNNKDVWGPVINGNVIINGSDPVYHSYLPGATTLTSNSVAFAVDKPGKTGMYISLSCYYYNASPGTPVPLLDAFGPGAFKVRQTNADTIHVVATHPALSGLTDSSLSNWGNSTHEAFDNFAPDFAPLAIAVGYGGYVAPDGRVGNPYIIARGVTVLSDINLQSDTHDTHFLGSTHSFTATVTKDSPTPGTPVVGTRVTFSVVSGPNLGRSGTGETDATGKATFSYTSSAAGVDLVKASFVDGAGRTQSSGTMQVTWLANQAPTADAGGNYDVNEGGTVILHGAGTDPEGGLLTYAWDLDEDGSFETFGKDPTFSAAALDGDYVGSHVHVKLRVTDDAGNSTESGGIVFIHNVAPTATFSNDGPVVYGAGATVSFAGASDPSSADTAAGFTYAYSLDGVTFSTPSAVSSAAYNLNAGSYTIYGRIYDKDGDYSEYSTTVTVEKANASISVGGYTGTYDGAAHGLSGSATGVGGEDLYALLLLGAQQTNAGTYATAWSFAGSDNYNADSGTATIQIAPRAVAVAADAKTKVYGQADPALTYSITGGSLVAGDSITGALSRAAGEDAGTYAIGAGTLTAGGNYALTFAGADLVIGKADAAVSVSGYAGGTYDGGAHTQTVTVTGVGGDGVLLTESLSGTNAGGYSKDWSFSSGNYNLAQGTLSFAIAKADAAISVSGYSGTYDGAAHGATGSATGVKGEALGGLDLGSSFTGAPGGTANWAFTDATGNYNNAAGSVAITIGKANATVTVTGGSFIYDGLAHPASGSVAGVGGASLGAPTFTYSYVDNAGNVVALSGAPVEPGIYTVTASFAGDGNYNPASATATTTIVYEATSLTDLSKAFKAGRTIPIKLQLKDANGNNISSSDIDLTAIRLERVNADGTRTVVTLADAGGSNSGNLFRYDAALGGYIFNLSTKGLETGTYEFFWMAEGDATEHKIRFSLI